MEHNFNEFLFVFLIIFAIEQLPFLKVIDFHPKKTVAVILLTDQPYISVDQNDLTIHTNNLK